MESKAIFLDILSFFQHLENFREANSFEDRAMCVNNLNLLLKRYGLSVGTGTAFGEPFLEVVDVDDPVNSRIRF